MRSVSKNEACRAASLHEVSYRNATQLRLMLAAGLARCSERDRDGKPVRQNRRMPLIEAALEPVRSRLEPETYRNLCDSLAFVLGVEPMTVAEDALGIDEERARTAKGRAIKALVDNGLAAVR